MFSVFYFWSAAVLRDACTKNAHTISNGRPHFPTPPIAPLPHILFLNLHKWAIFSRFMFNISRRNRSFMIFWRQFEIGRHPPHLWSREDKIWAFFFSNIIYLRGEPVFRWTAYKRCFFWDQKFQKGEPHTSQKWGVMSFLNGSASARNRVVNITISSGNWQYSKFRNLEKMNFFSDFSVKKSHMRKKSNWMIRKGVYPIRLKKIGSLRRIW